MTAHASALPRSGSNRFCSRAAVKLFLRENSVEPSSLTPQDAALAYASTPDAIQKGFTTGLIGGNPEHERPLSRERTILCLSPVAQPHRPNSPGESVLLLPPATVQFEDNYTSFHVFVDMPPPETRARDRTYRYLGTYTKLPTFRMTIKVDECLSLPNRLSRSLPLPHTKAGILPQCLARVIRLTSPLPVVPYCLVVAPPSYIVQRACYACEGQYTQDASAGFTPSPDEIYAWLETYPGGRRGITEATLFEALNVGDEKFDFAV